MNDKWKCTMKKFAVLVGGGNICYLLLGIDRPVHEGIP